MRFSDVTTVRVGGTPASSTEACSVDELVSAVRERDSTRQPVLIVGGGSNLVVADGDLDIHAILVRSQGITETDSSECAGSTIRVEAGHSWDDLVRETVQRGLVGLEPLSGIPGSVGATPMQNVGAYGADISQHIAQVRTWDRHTRQIRTYTAAECGFGYRTSLFKTSVMNDGQHRFVILDVTFQLRHGDLSAPIAYGELATSLGIDVGERAPALQVREKVLELRARKGMVLDELDHDTWSTGSFFQNPVVPTESVPDGAPTYPVDDPSKSKTSSAWLIENAGFAKGYGSGAVTLSTKHTLAITNRGQARAKDIIDLAREIRNGVYSTYGIDLVPEPILVGCAL